MKADTRRSSNSDGVRIVICTTLNPIARRQERVKALYEVGVAREERADSADYAGRVYGATLEILHDVQESIVHVWMLRELDLHLVKIAQSVVEDGLLPLALSLGLALGLSWLSLLLRRLLLTLLLLLRYRLCWWEGHQQTWLHLLLSWRTLTLGCWKDWTTEDVSRATGRAQWQMRMLRLGCGGHRVVQETIWPMRCSRPDCDRLV